MRKKKKHGYIKDIDGFGAYGSDLFANSGLIPQGPPYAAQELLAEPAAASAPHSSCQMRPEKVEQTDLSAEF